MRVVILALLAASQAAALSLILQSMDPYCFNVEGKRGNEIKVSYMVSGLNEEQVEFKVILFMFIHRQHSLRQARRSTGSRTRGSMKPLSGPTERAVCPFAGASLTASRRNLTSHSQWQT